jgi:hypothetical protein
VGREESFALALSDGAQHMAIDLMDEW